MFYIVSIKREESDIRSLTITFDNNSKRILGISGKSINCSFGIYDSTDNSIEYTDVFGLIKCFNLGIRIIGVTPRYNRGSMKGSTTLMVSKASLPCDNMFKLDKVINLNRNESFNPNILRYAGVTNFDNIDYILVGDKNKDGKRLDASLIYRDEWFVIKSALVKHIDNCMSMHKDRIVFIEDTIMIKDISKSGKVSCYHLPPNISSITGRSSIKYLLDLYIIALFKPELIKFCTIVSDTEFIVDTLSSRNIYTTDSRLRKFILKDKLLGGILF